LTARCRDGEIRVAIHVLVYDNVTQYISALAFLEDRGPPLTCMYRRSAPELVAQLCSEGVGLPILLITSSWSS
jgi:hypothetical protein